MATNRTILLPLGLSTAYVSCTTQYFRWSNIDAKQLGNQPIVVASIMEVFLVLRIQFVFIVFAIYPKLLNFTFIAFIPQEYLPLVLKPFHHGPYQDPQAL